MIIGIWLLLVGLMVGAIVLERSTESMVYGVMAMAFMFSAGLGLINGVEFVSGQTIDTTVTPIVVANTYTTYTNTIYGALIAAIAIFALPMYGWAKGWFR